MSTSTDIYEDCLLLFHGAESEENALAFLNGGLAVAILVIEQQIRSEADPLRKGMIKIQIDYLRGAIDAYTQHRLGRTFREDMEAMIHDHRL